MATYPAPARQLGRRFLRIIGGRHEQADEWATHYCKDVCGTTAPREAAECEQCPATVLPKTVTEAIVALARVGPWTILYLGDLIL
jgi:hypothetical protein